MGRRSPNDPVVINARVPRGVGGWWEVIKQLDAAGPWSIGDVDRETNQRTRSIANYIRRLVKGGFARVVRVQREGRGRPSPYHRLVRKPKDAPRLRADGSPANVPVHLAMWRVMRTSPQFTQRDLAFLATVSEPVPVSTARWYANTLLTAGYLIALPRRARNAPVTYRLKPGMNTGPQAPHILEVKAVWDPNLHQVVGEGIVAEEAA